MHGEQLAARRGGGGGDSASGAPATAAASAASGHASPLRRFLSGALSGTLSNALLQPFDVVRSVQQAQLLSAPRDGGALATARRLVASEGWPALWKGLAPAILRVFFGAGIYFVALDAIQRRLAAATTATAAPPHAVAPSNDPAAAAVAAAIASAAAAESSRLSAASPPTAWSAGARDFVAGACARTFAATVMLPVAVVKTRMELAPRGTAHFRTPFHGMAHLARSEGAGALFRGLLPTVARDAPFSGLYLACYTAVLRRLDDAADADRSPGGESSGAAVAPQRRGLVASTPLWLRNFGAAVVAGTAASLVTQPADLLKTRQQMRPAGTEAAQAPALAGAPAGSSISLRAALAQRGIRVLFVGGVARLAKRIISTAITWTLFEEGMRRSGGG